MLSKYIRHIFSCSLLMLVIAGCASSPTEPPIANITVIAPTPTFDENGYPAPTVSGAYPGPDGNVQVPPVTKVVPTSIPQTPDPELGVVKGSLLLLDKPIGNAILYLAPVITSETGGQMVRFDRTTSFRTVTNEQGEFNFINIPPGDYGLVIDILIEPYLLLEPEGDSLIVTVVSNEEIDLGDLNYDDLPLPPEE